MTLYYEGVLLGVCTFLAIGIFHPITIKTEYYFGTRPWWVFLAIGIGCAVGALFVESVFWSALLGIVGFSSLWTIGELFHQRGRVRRGWFPMNPKRAHEYNDEPVHRFHSKKFHERFRKTESEVYARANAAKQKQQQAKEAQ